MPGGVVGTGVASPYKALNAFCGDTEDVMFIEREGSNAAYYHMRILETEMTTISDM